MDKDKKITSRKSGENVYRDFETIVAMSKMLKRVKSIDEIDKTSMDLFTDIVCKAHELTECDDKNRDSKFEIQFSKVRRSFIRFKSYEKRRNIESKGENYILSYKEGIYYALVDFILWYRKRNNIN